VQRARERIAQLLGCIPDDVTLFFSAKTLKDQFRLDRLRVGTNAITVCTRNLETFLVLTSRANRAGR
jgi:hypothetical protein